MNDSFGEAKLDNKSIWYREPIWILRILVLVGGFSFYILRYDAGFAYSRLVFFASFAAVITLGVAVLWGIKAATAPWVRSSLNYGRQLFYFMTTGLISIGVLIYGFGFILHPKMIVRSALCGIVVAVCIALPVWKNWRRQEGRGI